MPSIPICVSGVSQQIALKQGCTTRKHSCLSAFQFRGASNDASDGSANPAKADRSRVATRVSSRGLAHLAQAFIVGLSLCLSFPFLSNASLRTLRRIMTRYQAMLVPHPAPAAVHETKSSDSKRAILRRNTERNYVTTHYLILTAKSIYSPRKFQITLLRVISTVITTFLREWGHGKIHHCLDIDSETCSEVWQTFFLTYILWNVYRHVGM